MEIKSLEHTDFEALYLGFGRAFADYEIHFEKDEVRSMLERRGYTPRLSFAAFDKGEIVAFTLNGTGIFGGIPTAYDTGTGTVREYRGQGLAGKIFSHSLPFLKEAGIGQYLLEVLQNNNAAIGVYRGMGFETTRELYCHRQSKELIENHSVNGDCRIEPVDADFVRQAQGFCDFNPSWQNSIDSITRGRSGLTCLGAMLDGETAGYCVLDASTGDLAQIAVKPEHRRRGIGSRLLHEATESMKTDFIKVLNIDSGNRTLPAFLESKRIGLASKQYEMILRL